MKLLSEYSLRSFWCTPRVESETSCFCDVFQAGLALCPHLLPRVEFSDVFCETLQKNKRHDCDGILVLII